MAQYLKKAIILHTFGVQVLIKLGCVAVRKYGALAKRKISLPPKSRDPEALNPESYAPQA